MCFLWTPKPTTSRLKPFNIHTLPRATLRGKRGGGVKRGFIIKKAKQEDCLEKTLKKTHLKSTSPRVFSGLWTTWPTGITPVAG